MTSSPTTATSWFLWLTCSNPTSTFIIIERLRGSRSFFARQRRSRTQKRRRDKKTKRRRVKERKRGRDKVIKRKRGKDKNRSMVVRWIRHLLRLTAAQSLRLCTWWIHSAVPAGKRFCLLPCDGCNPTGGWCGRLKIRSLLGNFQPAQHQRLVRVVCIKRKGFFRFLSFIHSFNFWTFRAFRVPKQISGFLMNQIHEH